MLCLLEKIARASLKDNSIKAWVLDTLHAFTRESYCLYVQIYIQLELVLTLENF